jgi:hypothetical protein
MEKQKMNLDIIPYEELLSIGNCAQVDSLRRWLDREEIVYMLDSKGHPLVLREYITERFQRKGTFSQ